MVEVGFTGLDSDAVKSVINSSLHLAIRPRYQIRESPHSLSSSDHTTGQAIDRVPCAAAAADQLITDWLSGLDWPTSNLFLADLLLFVHQAIIAHCIVKIFNQFPRSPSPSGFMGTRVLSWASFFYQSHSRQVVHTNPLICGPAKVPWWCPAILI